MNPATDVSFWVDMAPPAMLSACEAMFAKIWFSAARTALAELDR